MHPVTPLRVGDEAPPELFYGPRLGEHTIEVMQMLGYSNETIQDYIQKGIVLAEQQ